MLDLIFETIDLRSFSNLWYWIALAVLWSTTSHWILGAPYDLIQRAAREGGVPLGDLQAVVTVHVRRTLFIARQLGVWLVGGVFFALTSLAILGFSYDLEFAQSLVLMAFPMSIVWALSIRTAFKIEAEGLSPDTLFRRLRGLRTQIHLIGVISIVATASYGTFLNFGGAKGFY